MARPVLLLLTRGEPGFWSSMVALWCLPFSLTRQWVRAYVVDISDGASSAFHFASPPPMVAPWMAIRRVVSFLLDASGYPKTVETPGCRTIRLSPYHVMVVTFDDAFTREIRQ